MRVIKWAGLLSAMLLIGISFLPWVVILSRDITVTGVYAEGTNFGKPAYFHFLAVILFIVFTLSGKLWSARGNLIVTALNMAWAIRNFLVLTMCRGGDCPEKKPAIFLVLATSIVMLIAALFPDIKLNKKGAVLRKR